VDGCTSQPQAQPAQWWRYAIVLAPVGLFLFLAIVARAFLDPLWDSSVVLIGVPMGIVILGIAAGFVLLGLAVVHRIRGVAGIFLALAVSSIPAVLLIVMGPAVVLIVLNLGWG